MSGGKWTAAWAEFTQKKLPAIRTRWAAALPTILVSLTLLFSIWGIFGVRYVVMTSFLTLVFRTRHRQDFRPRELARAAVHDDPHDPGHLRQPGIYLPGQRYGKVNYLFMLLFQRFYYFTDHFVPSGWQPGEADAAWLLELAELFRRAERELNGPEHPELRRQLDQLRSGPALSDERQNERPWARFCGCSAWRWRRWSRYTRPVS